MAFNHDNTLMSKNSCYPHWEQFSPPPPYNPSLNSKPYDFQVLEKEGNDNVKRNYKGEPLYETSNGEEAPSIQSDSSVRIPEKLDMQKIPGYTVYPFNTTSNGKVTSVHAKINNANITISNGQIFSSEPLMLMILDFGLYIWTSSVNENRLLTNKGRSIVDGYNILDFYGKRKKVEAAFNYTNWKTCQICLNELEINGSNNQIRIENNCLDKDCRMKIYGRNNINIDQAKYQNLSIYSSYSTINLNESNTRVFKVTMVGTGSLKGITTMHSVDSTIIGDGELHISITPETKIINKKEFGGGKILFS